MIDRAVNRALRRLGARAELHDTCPMCGGSVTVAHDRVEAWPGKFAHRRCATYSWRGSRTRRRRRRG